MVRLMINIVLEIINMLFRLYGFLLIASVILSWVRPQRSALTDLLGKLTEPVLMPCRELLRAFFGLLRIDANAFPLDFSPILAILLVETFRKAFFTVIFHFL